MRKSKFFQFLTIGGVCLTVAACQTPPKMAKNAYWQRIESHSALYLTGPKAQQQLDQNIAGCVREIDELVELEAMRETLPPDTHHEYHSSLEDSGDLAAWETPTRAGKNLVDHSDYHDFESCMRAKGWERVKYVRYQAARQARNTRKATQELRKYGVTGPAVKRLEKERQMHSSKEFNTLND